MHLDAASAAVLFPTNAAPAAPVPTGLPSVVAPAAPAAPKPAASPNPAQAAPATAQPAAPEKSLQETFFPSMADGAADPAADPAAASNAAPATIDFIDASHPDADAALPVVQELGLDRDKTARLVALHETMTNAAIERQSTAWRAESDRLPPQDINDARDAIRAFGSPELSAVLNQTGIGNHPALVKALAQAFRSNPLRNF